MSINKKLLDNMSEEIIRNIRAGSAFANLQAWNERLEAMQAAHTDHKLTLTVDRTIERKLPILRERIYNDILCSYRLNNIIRHELERLEARRLYNRRSARAVRAVHRFGWRFLHNAVAHPLLVIGAGWTNRFHDWTAYKI